MWTLSLYLRWFGFASLNPPGLLMSEIIKFSTSQSFSQLSTSTRSLFLFKGRRPRREGVGVGTRVRGAGMNGEGRGFFFLTSAVSPIPFTLRRVAGLIAISVTDPVGGAAFVTAGHWPCQVQLQRTCQSINQSINQSIKQSISLSVSPYWHSWTYY